MNQTNQKLAFVLGREHEICLAELKAVLDRFDFCFSALARQRRDGNITRISGNVVFANIDNFFESDAIKLINALAGTIKIFRITNYPSRLGLAETDELGIKDVISTHSVPAAGRFTEGEKSLCNIVEPFFKEKDKQSKINFGISDYTGKLSAKDILRLGLSVKKALKNRYKLRFVAPRDSNELSSIVSLKNRLDREGIEIGIFDEGTGILISLNNPEGWNDRDYGKPASDKYSGMTPPKLARMMVNLALGEIENKRSKIKNKDDNEKFKNDQINEKWKMKNGKSDDLVVVDCFCGSGNIILEAMMLGCNVIGSDISERAVNDTKTNIEWLKREYQVSSIKYQVSEADAIKLDFQKLLIADNCELTTSHKNLVFVTEPFLGEPKKFMPTFNSTKGEYEKVKELYINFLKNVTSLSSSGLTRGSMSLDSRLRGNDSRGVVICLIFPLIETTDRGRFSLFSECVDEIKDLGYTQIRPSLIYGRDYQVVKREIVQLKLARI